MFKRKNKEAKIKKPRFQAFRDAYKEVGESIERGEFEPMREVNHNHEGSIGNLCNDKIEALMQEVLSQFKFEKIDTALNKLLTV